MNGTMNGTVTRILMLTMLAGSVGIGTSAMAQSRAYWRDVHHDRVDLRHDYRDVHRDRVDLRQDHRQLVRDERNGRYGAAARERREIAGDRHDLRFDRRDIRSDHRDLRWDYWRR